MTPPPLWMIVGIPLFSMAVGLFVVIYVAVHDWWMLRWIKRENARIQREYDIKCLIAKEQGKPPPWPPNRLEAR